MSIPMQIKFLSRLREDELEQTHSYLTRNERLPLIVFEGRLDERAHIKDQIAAVQKSGKPICSTVVIEGAPGAGKTSLLNQIEKENLDGPINSGVIPIMMEVEVFNDPVLFLEKFLLHREVNFEALSKSYTQDGKGKVDLKLLELGGGIQSHLPALDTQIRESPGRIWNVIRQSLYPSDDPIFLLMVDEAQRIEPNSGSKNTLVSNLHGAVDTSGLKIIGVFAGLSDTGKCLEQVGITRRSREDFMLSSLSHEEGRQVCTATIEKLGLEKLFTPSQIDHIAHSLDIASDSWPRHLHRYLQTLVKEVANSHLKGTSYLDLNQVLDEGHAIRIQYYQTRLQVKGQRQFDKELNQIAKDHQTEGKKITYEKLSGCFFEKVTNLKEVEEIIDSYVHNGILDELLDGSYVFPIPSLETFLASGRDVDKTKEMLRSKVREATGG